MAQSTTTVFICCISTRKKLGLHEGQRPKSDRLAPKLVALIEEGRSYRWIARDLDISKNSNNTVMDIVNRARAVA